MPINVVDVAILLIVVICLIYGWNTGVLRQAVAVSAVLFALMCANAFYLWLGAWWAAAAGLQAPTYLDGIAYVFVLVLAAALWLLVMRRVYPYTRLAASEVGNWAWSLDRFGGLLLGAVLGVLVAGSVVGAVELLVYYRWGGQPGARGVRDVVHAQIKDATLLKDVFEGAPESTEFVTYWLPGMRVAREGNILP